MNIEVQPTECGNLSIRARQGRNTVDVVPVPSIHQWFMGTFTGLPVGSPVTIRLCMAGHDSGRHIADCRKWVGLRPLLTYADPAQFDTYLWYRRTHGSWISGDLAAPADAGTAQVPVQGVLPPELALAGLSDDGTIWQPWQEVEGGIADTDARTFTVRFTPARDTATLALHVPFTPGYHEQFLARLRAARLPGGFVDDLGSSSEGRPLAMVRVDDPAQPTPLTLDDLVRPDGTRVPVWRMHDAGAPRVRVHLLIAREHGAEHTPSWALMGALRRLLSSPRLRHRTTWLLLFLYDPDGAAHSTYHNLTDRFFPHRNHPVYGDVTPPEVVAYVRYLRAFVNSGRPLLSATSFYGLECNEGPPVLCPFINRQEKELTFDFNTAWFARLQAQGIPTGPPRQAWDEGWTPYRLHGWCWYWYRAFAPVFEINDRFPDHRLTLPGIEEIGAEYPAALAEFFDTPAGRARVAEIHAFLAQRAHERDLWFRTPMSGTPDDPSLYDMLSMGY